ERPALDPYLAEAEPAARPALLVELVQEDLDYRLKAGEAIHVEDYLQRYPELQPMRDAVIELITAEYRQCVQLGRPASVAEYLRRFPQWRSELAHRLDAGDATMPTPSPPTVSEAWPKRIGAYEIEGEVARGGMGAVLRARDPHFHRPLALKVL